MENHQVRMPVVRAGPTSVNGPREVLQGKFGFEVELGVALGWSAAPETDQESAKYGSPDPHVEMPRAARGDGFDVHVDHSTDITAVRDSYSIVELVTRPPLDEATSDPGAVKGHVKRLTDFVASASGITGGFARRAKLGAISGVTGTLQKDGHLFVGGEGVGGQQAKTGYLQSTFAVDLAAVPKVLEDHSTPSVNVSAPSRVAMHDAATSTRSVENSFLSQIQIIKYGWKKAAVEPAKSDPQESTVETAPSFTYTSAWGTKLTDFRDVVAHTKEGLAPLMGLLSLMINYLRAGAMIKRNPASKLRKTHLGLFYYKTGLHNLRNALTGASRFAVENEDTRMNLSLWLLDASGRAGEDPLCDVQHAFEPDEDLAGALSTTTAMGWIDNVLEGAADPIFEASLNRYSKELGPEDVGPVDARKTGVVLESRRMAPSGGYTYEGAGKPVTRGTGVEPDQSQNHRSVDEWEKIALDLWTYLRRINGIEE